MSACSASRSVTFPLPSSPHWAPTTILTLISAESRSERPQTAEGRPGCCESGESRARGVVALAQVLAEHRDLVRHLRQARDDPLADLLLQLVPIEVRRHEYRFLRLVALVHQAVEL